MSNLKETIKSLRAMIREEEMQRESINDIVEEYLALDEEVDMIVDYYISMDYYGLWG